MLTLLPVKGDQIVLERRVQYRTHLGCTVEMIKRAFVYEGTNIAGQPMEHVTLSAPPSVFERACHAG